MKIENKTCWQTKHLRTFVNRIARDELEPAKRKRVTIRFVPARQQRGASGWAHIKGTLAQIAIPTKTTEINKRDFARLLAHELAHLHGHSGERWMRASKRYGRDKSGDLYAWADDLPLEHKPPKQNH